MSTNRNLIVGAYTFLFMLAAGLVPAAPSMAQAVDPPQAVQLFDTAANLFRDAESRDDPAAARQNYQLAIEQWEKLLNEYPTFSEIEDVQFFLGISHYHLRDYPAATKYLEGLRQSLASLSDYRRSDQLLFFLAFCQYSTGKQQGGQGADSLNDAVATYQKFLADHSDSQWVDQALFFNGETFYQLYQITDRSEALDNAAAAYRKLIDHHAESAFRSKAMFGLGACLEEAGSYEQALKVYQDYLREFPNESHVGEVRLRTADATMQVAIAAANAGDEESADRKFEEAASLFGEAVATPDFDRADNALFLQAYCLLRLNRPKQAADLYARVANEFADSEFAAEATLAAGKFYFTANEYDTARQWLQNSIETSDDSHAEATHWLCRIYIEQKQFEQAFQTAEQALDQAEDSPFTVNLLMDAADALYEIPERRRDSIPFYQRVAENYPEHELTPKALYYAAYTHLDTGQPAEAVKLAEQFKRDYPNDSFLPDAIQVLGEALLKEQQYSQATSVFRELAASHDNHPNRGWWQTRLGWSLYLQKQYDEVIATLSTAVADIPSPKHQSEAHYLIGASQFQTGGYAKAIEALKQALEIHPDRSNAEEARLLIARAHFQLGDNEPAVNMLQTVLDDSPGEEIAGQASYWLGEIQYAAGDYANAVAHYDSVIRAESPANLVPNSLYGKAWALLKSEDHATAAAAFDRLIDEFASHELVHDALIGRGMTRRMAGDYDGAIEDFDKFLAGNPSDQHRFSAQYERGLAYVGLKQWDQAIASLQPLAGDSEHSGQLADDILYELAWAYKNQGDTAEALEQFESLADAHADSSFAAEANYHLAQNLYDDKQYDEAIRRYRECLKTVRDDSIAERAAYKLGWSYFQKDDFASARTAFKIHTEKFPEGNLAADGLFMISETLYRDGQHEQAVTAYKVALPALHNATNVNQHVKMLAPIHGAQSANKMKQYQTAIEFVEPLINEHPDSDYAPDAWFEMGTAYKGLGQADQAVEAWTHALTSLGKTGARARCMIAEQHFEKGQHDEAIKQFKLVMYGYGGLQSADEIKPWQAFAAYEAARCNYVQIKEEQDRSRRATLIAQAKELFRYVVDNFPNDRLAADAKKQLDILEQL